ncbi:MAG TPA: hypothetical protein VIT93_01580 [Dehalococcoidia bacterium]
MALSISTQSDVLGSFSIGVATPESFGPQACDDTDGDGTCDYIDPDDDNDGYWDNDEQEKASDPLDPASTPEHCDGVDNDGDTLVDEPPQGSGRVGVPDPLCNDSVDVDGDTVPNSDDWDDDGDGWSDEQERHLSTDELDDCGEHDAWPPDLVRNQSINIFDLLVLKISFGTSEGDLYYNKRHDLMLNGTINIFDVLGYRSILMLSCGSSGGGGPV